mmetsp:Transcript_2459/g.6315  ORF Transcript_2459/g.6315 Transcript_2459/m.6315 type:complete len:222 (+) Transcript_2459:442-1107(+)
MAVTEVWVRGSGAARRGPLPLEVVGAVGVAAGPAPFLAAATAARAEPWCVMPRTAASTPRWSSTSRNVVSSSSSRMAGLSASAPAMATRWRCPPDSVCVARYMKGSMLTRRSADDTAAATSLSAMSYLPSPNATSAATVGMTTWWSGFWNTNPVGWSSLMLPELGATRPPSTLSSVDFPQPLGPSSMCREPRLILRFVPLSTVRCSTPLPNCTYRSSTVTA